MKPRLLLLLGLLLPLLTFSQTRYKATTGPDGKQIVRRESVPGSGVFDVVVSSLPSDAVRARTAGRVLIPYAPESAQTFTPSQFGAGKYYAPSFRFSVDFAGGRGRSARLAVGENTFNDFSIQESERTQFQAGEGQAYVTESTVHHTLEGVGVYEADLQTYYNMVWERCPLYGYGQLAFTKYVILNYETSNDWSRNSYTGENWHRPSWESSKNKSIKCESDGVVRTLDQINSLGASWWANEMRVRRANRYALSMEIIKRKCAPGTKVSMGGSPYQGLPRQDFKGLNNLFLEGNCNVSNIGGDGQGNITFQQPGGGTQTYRLNGQLWDHEDFTTGYYYLFNFNIAQNDYNDIAVNKLSGTQNYPYLWSKIQRRHIVADEKGYLQLNRRLQRINQGKVRPIWRMVEPMYESGGQVGSSFDVTFVHAPFAGLQNTIPMDGGAFDSPKVWQPPYLMYSRYMVTRFFAGGEADWGFYVFPTNPQMAKKTPADFPAYQHELHTYSALYQARADMQPYEQYFARSSLVEDPEIQLNQSGGWSTYDGTEAYNYADGVQGTQKPAYMLRYEATATGWRVLVLGGMNQDWTQERTDLVRVPGGGLNGNMFRVKLRGPSAQVYEFSVSSSDANQIYDATPTAQTAWEKPGYGGRVGSATAVITPPSNGTTTTGLRSFNRGLFIGNSFTSHTASTALNWPNNNGMAASSLATDYVHVMESAFKGVNPSFFAVPKGQGSGFELGYNSSDAEAVNNTLSNLNFELNRDYPGQQFDLVYFSISENIAAGSFDATKFRAMLDKVIAGIPKTSNATVILRNSFWAGNDPSNVFLRQYAAEKGYIFVDLDGIRERADYKASSNQTPYGNAGVDHHPNDPGHAAIAQLSLAPLKTGSTAPVTGSLAARGGFAEGSMTELFALAPFAPDQNQAGSWTSGLRTMENEFIRTGLDREVTGEMTIAIDKRNGANQINTYFNPASNRKDTGRSKGSLSAYGSPKGANQYPYTKNGKSTSSGPGSDDTGYNGVAPGGGDQSLSTLLFYQRKEVAGYGTVDYTSIRMQQWSMPNEPTEYIRHTFYWIQGRASYQYVILENFRSDDQKRNEGRQQEMDLTYVLAENYQHKIELAPGVVSTVYSPVPFQNGAGNPTNTTNLISAGNYMGVYNPSTGMGLTLFQPHNSRFEGKQFLSRFGNNPADNDCSYVSGAPLFDADTPANAGWLNVTHYGTHEEFLNWKTATNIPLRPFSFDFSGGRFQGWYSIGARLTKENDVTTYALGGQSPYVSDTGGGTFNSPFGNWSASSLSTLKFTMAVSGTSQVELRWLKPGQADADGTRQRKTFSVTGDGQYRTYTFNLNDGVNFNGTISQISVGNPPGSTSNGTQFIRLQSITN